MYVYNLGLRFEQIVEKYQDHVALKFSEKNLATYGSLNSLANKIAGLMVNNKVGSGDVVGISGDKHLFTFAVMIACLKIGAVYTVFDPANPAERFKKILNTSRPKLLFMNSKLQQNLVEVTTALSIKIISNELDKMNSIISDYPDTNPEETKRITGTAPAYIMFTSGSTGFPKGAVMTHDNILNLIDWGIGNFSIGPDDILTNVNPLYFDNSVFDFYSSVFSGATLVPFSREQVSDARLLVTLIDELKCTQWFSVPSMLIFLQTMKALNKNNFKYIKRIIFGGEGYAKAKLHGLFNLYNERIEFFNVYGPTECSCICSSYKITAQDFDDLTGFPPLGQMISNFNNLILDENNTKVADNEFGELCLLGPNVGKGYYNDSDTTKKSFIQNPYNQQYHELLYKTGDIVKYNPHDNKIYIGGRKDNQIKHMGYRIEMEEIETALSQIRYIEQAAVVHGSSRGLSKLIAVISSNSDVDEKILRDELKHIIPNYMMPNVFHSIEEMPKNPNGKIDRQKLKELYV